MEKIFSNVFYFPSYEIINSPSNAGKFFSDDLRSINNLGINHIMKIFSKHFIEMESKKHFNITFICLFFILGIFSCNKKSNSITPTKTTNSGIFGKVLLYDEYGELQSDYSGLKITGYCLDSTYLIDTIHKKYYDSTFTVVSDQNGNFSVLKCHQGVYVFTLTKDQFGTHKFVGSDHSSS